MTFQSSATKYNHFTITEPFEQQKLRQERDLANTTHGGQKKSASSASYPTC